jgi:hypothetical protein
MKAWGALSEDIQKDMIGVADAAAATGTSLEIMGNIIGRAFMRGRFRLRGPGAMLRGMMKTKGMIDDMNEVSLPEFRKQLALLLTDPQYGIAGASEKLAGTWTGIKSMISDSMTILKKSIADAGLYDEIKQLGTTIREWLRTDDVIRQFSKLGRIGANVISDLKNKFISMIETGQINELLSQWTRNISRWGSIVQNVIKHIPTFAKLLGNMIEGFSLAIKNAVERINKFMNAIERIRGVDFSTDLEKANQKMAELVTKRERLKEEVEWHNELAEIYGWRRRQHAADVKEELLVVMKQIDAHALVIQKLVKKDGLLKKNTKELKKLLSNLNDIETTTGNITANWDDFYSKFKAGQGGAGAPPGMMTDEDVASVWSNAQKNIKDSTKGLVSAREVTSRISGDLTDIVMQTQSWNEGLTNIANSISRMFIQKGIEAGMSGMLSSANGNVFTSPAVTSIGERGPEAVVPLQRDKQGRLGLAKEGESGGGATINVQAMDSSDVVRTLTRDPRVVKALRNVVAGGMV